MAALRVRVYNVRFGDAVLVTVPERVRGKAVKRHMLVDFGNVLADEGGVDEVFQPILQDVLAELDGRPLDLYVMTHEHMDHVQGLLHCSRAHGLTLPVTHAWLTASAQPGYYDNHPKARKKLDDARAAYRGATRFLGAVPEARASLGPMLFNNNPRRTGDCVEFLRGVASKKTTYVHRTRALGRSHPFTEAQLEVWAPEEDSSIYYGTFQPSAFAVRSGGAAGADRSLGAMTPPRGVDNGAFQALVESRARGVFDNLLSIDRAANNSSVVFAIEWRGWRLLFPGDAEHRSWKEMHKRGVLKPAHFLKVSHHGSWNGTPTGEILDQILPARPPDRRQRHAAVSTCTGTYHNVPDEETLARLKERCRVHSVEESPGELFLDIEFPG